MHKHFNLILVIISIFVTSASSHWSYTKEQGEVYEIVDDFKGNFYDFLGIPQVKISCLIQKLMRNYLGC